MSRARWRACHCIVVDACGSTDLFDFVLVIYVCSWLVTPQATPRPLFTMKLQSSHSAMFLIALALVLLALATHTQGKPDDDCDICDLCDVMAANDVQVPALILCNEQGEMMAMDSPIYQQAAGSYIWAKPSRVCARYADLARKDLAGPTYLLSCTFHTTSNNGANKVGAAEQRIFDAGDGVGMYAMLVSGAPANGAKDLISDEGNVVPIAETFIEREGITGGLQRVTPPQPASRPGRTAALRRYGSRASSATHTYINKSRAASLGYSVYRRASGLAGFGSTVPLATAPERIARSLAETTISMNYIRETVDCIVRAAAAVKANAYDSVVYQSCLDQAAKAREAAITALSPINRGNLFIIAKYAEQAAVDRFGGNRRLLVDVSNQTYGRALAAENLRLRFKVLELYDTDALLTDTQFARMTLCTEAAVVELGRVVEEEAERPLLAMLESAGARTQCGR